MQDFQKDLKKFVISWNNHFPLDKWWRERYRIPFGSPAHLEANQTDILFEYLEQEAYAERDLSAMEEVKRKALLEKGIWINKVEVPEDNIDEMFDKIEF